MPAPFVSIVIPARNEEALLGACLASLDLLDYPKDRYEVIIADGLSTDRTAAIAAEHGAKVVPNPGMTVACGRNVGFSAAQGDIIAFSDADCVMPPSWLARAVAHFERDPGLSGLGGPSPTPPGSSIFQNAVSVVFALAGALTHSVHKEAVDAPKEAKDIPGCNCFYRRAALAEVMPVNESLLTAEDVDTNHRIRVGGGKLLMVPDVALLHDRRPSPRRLWRQMYRFAIGRLQVGKLDRRMINAAHVAAGLLLPALSLVFVASMIWGTRVLLAPALATVAGGALMATATAVRCRSAATAVAAPIAACIIALAWSAGFIRELFFPMKRVHGH